MRKSEFEPTRVIAHLRLMCYVFATLRGYLVSRIDSWLTPVSLYLCAIVDCSRNGLRR